MNAADTQAGIFAITCQHTTCKTDLDGPDYVDLICQTHGLAVDDLRAFVDDDAAAAAERNGQRPREHWRRRR